MQKPPSDMADEELHAEFYGAPRLIRLTRTDAVRAEMQRRADVRMGKAPATPNV